MSHEGETSSTELREMIEGSGTLMFDDAHTVPVTFTLNRNAADSSLPWTLVAYFRDDDYDGIKSIIDSGRSSLKFDGLSADGRPVSCDRVYWREAHQHRITAEVNEVTFEPEAALHSYKHLSLTIWLSSTDLALSPKRFLVKHWTGEIKPYSDKREENNKPHLITAETKRFEFGLRYRFMSTEVGSTQADLRIGYPALYTNLIGSIGSDPPAKVGRRILSDLEPAFRLFSFLSRRHITWTSLIISGSGSDAEGIVDRMDFEIRRAGITTGKKSRRGYLVNARRVPEDGFDRLITNLRQLPYREAAMSSIVYLVEANSTRFIESQVVNAFTALEALTTGFAKTLGSEFILKTSQFKRLASDMRRLIREFCSDESQNGRNGDLIAAKIPELNRPTFLSRIQHAVDHYDVTWNDLWPEANSAAEALQPAVRRRNEFIHAGHLKSAALALKDATLIVALTERLLYNAIGGEGEWLHPTAFADALHRAKMSDQDL